MKVYIVWKTSYFAPSKMVSIHKTKDLADAEMSRLESDYATRMKLSPSINHVESPYEVEEYELKKEMAK